MADNMIMLDRKGASVGEDSMPYAGGQASHRGIKKQNADVESGSYGASGAGENAGTVENAPVSGDDVTIDDLPF